MSEDGVLGEVYSGSFRRLVVQLYAVTGDLGEAQEAVQEAFVRAAARPRLFAALDNHEAWLRRVALNVARSRYRRHRLLRGLLHRIGPPPVVPETSAEHVALMQAMRQLPRSQRDTLALHYLADLPVNEVAEALGVSAGTVKSRLSRGRQALALLLTEPTLTGSAHA
ncbi:sigma-70 family RNA polymerase sigma factor [Micromonospora sp. NPDC049679]|uniref:sigma-70 family RNA polymerase sigma factor n=1 Tax=Micromonospora sp. NPDC049679 TaxID=3155920 RepID=UPI0033F4159B